MITQVDHRESWVIEIIRQQADEWPDIGMGHSGKRVMHPDLITATLTRGDGRIRAGVQGRVYHKDGSLGVATGFEPFGLDHPWVAAMIREAREQLHLGHGATGVAW